MKLALTSCTVYISQEISIKFTQALSGFERLGILPVKVTIYLESFIIYRAVRMLQFLYWTSAFEFLQSSTA